MKKQFTGHEADTLFVGSNTLRLILRFATPAILSLLVNSVYSMVDQIFIGQGVGFLGNAAVNVLFPVTISIVALAALIGDGAAVNFSLLLGQDDAEGASRCVLTSMLMATVSSLIFAVLGALTAEPLMGFLGTTPALLDMTRTYLYITLAGVPLLTLSTVISGQIRADGSPGYAMCSMLAGCVVNILLDALFILQFHWGVAGAAAATVVGQLVNLVIALLYLPRFQTIALKLHPSQLSTSLAVRILKLGLAGFVNQFAAVFYTVVANRYLVRYGALSPYGSEIPLAAFGIVSKLNQLAMAFVHGIAVGVQPIIGYNYSRRNLDQVKQCLKTAILIATSTAAVFAAIFQLFPRAIISIFGKGDPLYIEYGVYCLRIFEMGLPLFGFSVVATGLFLAIGKPAQATIMALSRQAIFIIPLMVILAPIWGVVGMLYAAPIGDVFAFSVCMTLYLRERRHLNRLSEAASVQ